MSEHSTRETHYLALHCFECCMRRSCARLTAVSSAALVLLLLLLLLLVLLVDSRTFRRGVVGASVELRSRRGVLGCCSRAEHTRNTHTNKRTKQNTR